MGTRSQVVLEKCGHTLLFEFPPMRGEQVWCVRCQTMRVVASAPTEYRVRCLRCAVSRPFGQSRLNAEVFAARHANKYGHRVRIYNGRELIYELRADSDPDLFTGIPPF